MNINRSGIPTVEKRLLVPEYSSSFCLLSHTRTRHEKIILSLSSHTHGSSLRRFICLLFREFSLFRDNSVLALHQICVVFNSVFKLLFFIGRIPKKIEFLGKQKKENDTARKRRRSVVSFVWLSHVLLPRLSGLVYFWVYRCGIRLLRQRDGHTCKFVCEFISDTSHHSLEEVHWGGINFDESLAVGLSGKRSFFFLLIFLKRSSDSSGKCRWFRTTPFKRHMICFGWTDRLKLCAKMLCYAICVYPEKLDKFS